MKISVGKLGRLRAIAWSALILIIVSALVESREIDPKTALLGRSRPGPKSLAGPVVEYAAHQRGNIQLAIANNGTFGTRGSSILDPLTGDAIPSCIFPKNSDLVYLWVAAIWAGAIKGRDTLVSVGDEISTSRPNSGRMSNLSVISATSQLTLTAPITARMRTQKKIS